VTSPGMQDRKEPPQGCRAGRDPPRDAGQAGTSPGAQGRHAGTSPRLQGRKGPSLQGRQGPPQRCLTGAGQRGAPRGRVHSRQRLPMLGYRACSVSQWCPGLGVAWVSWQAGPAHGSSARRAFCFPRQAWAPRGASGQTEGNADPSRRKPLPCINYLDSA
jgi:hypothetical protein